MSRIGIDCRFWGVGSGIARYLQELVVNLQKVDTRNDYVLFCLKKDIDLVPEKKRWHKVLADVPCYSLREQLELPWIFSKQKLDLLHVPHFNVPLLYSGKFILTIHDLLWHDMKGLQTTTRPALVYWAKYLGYRFQIKAAALRASKILAPSNFVRTEVAKKLGVAREKIIVTYEGISDLKGKGSKTVESYGIQKQYLLNVGSLYPHKNVEQVVRAIRRYRDLNHDIDLRLVIVGGRGVFGERFRRFIEKENAQEAVKMVGFVPDGDLAELYRGAEAFVFPTLSEGFGLPGLEAMSVGTPVLCSNLPVLHEIYQDAALYFDPGDVSDIVDKIAMIFTAELRDNLVREGRKRIKFFSWEKMAVETLAIYKTCLETSSVSSESV